MFWLCFIFYNNTISYQMQGKKKGTALQSLPHLLFHDLRYYACTYRASAFTNCKPQSFFHCNLRDQLDRHHYVVSGHYHLYPFRQLDYPRYIRRSEVKLRSVSIEERRMSSALFLRLVSLSHHFNVLCAVSFSESGYKGTAFIFNRKIFRELFFKFLFKNPASAPVRRPPASRQSFTTTGLFRFCGCKGTAFYLSRQTFPHLFLPLFSTFFTTH